MAKESRFYAGKGCVVNQWGKDVTGQKTFRTIAVSEKQARSRFAAQVKRECNLEMRAKMTYVGSCAAIT